MEGGHLAIVSAMMVGRRGGRQAGRRSSQQLAAEREHHGTMAVGEEAVMPDTMEPIGQAVQ